MSLMTKTGQVAVASAAAKRARQAAGQIGPTAKSARDTAALRIHGARRWAAPRMKRAARTVQEDVAPKVSAALEAAAQRIEPAPEKLKKLSRRAQSRARKAPQQVSARRMKILGRRQPARRWPKMMGGVGFAMATAGAVAAAVMRRGRDTAAKTDLDTGHGSAVTDEAHPASAEAEAGDGQLRTP